MRILHDIWLIINLVLCLISNTNVVGCVIQFSAMNTIHPIVFHFFQSLFCVYNFTIFSMLEVAHLVRQKFFRNGWCVWLTWCWSKRHRISLLWLLIPKEVESDRNTSFLFKIIFCSIEVILPCHPFYFFYFLQVVLVYRLFEITYHFALALNIQISIWR